LEYERSLINNAHKTNKIPIGDLTGRDDVAVLGFFQFEYTNMFDFVEKVVYINLKHRTDRDITVSTELKKYFPPEKILRFDAIRNEKHGYIGCTESHIAVLKMAITNGWKNCLIVEDDAKWSNFEKAYPILEKLVRNPFDVITLGTTRTKYDSSHKLLSGQTATGYLVKDHYYSSLLENFVDGLKGLIHTNIYGTYALDQYWKRLQARDNWYCVVPSLLVQTPSYSDIEKKNVNYLKHFN